MTDLNQHWRLAFENKFVGAWNLWDAKKGAYRTATVKIAEIRDERVTMQGGRKENARLIFFEGKSVPMIMSKTMGKALESMFGPVPAKWIGQTITLYVERGVRVRDGVADVLRIRNDKAGAGLKRALRGEAEPTEEEAPHAPVEQFGEDEPREPGVD